MNHHPVLVLQMSQDVQRSYIEAAERHRLARNVDVPRRRFWAGRRPPPHRPVRVLWRRPALVARLAR